MRQSKRPAHPELESPPTERLVPLPRATILDFEIHGADELCSALRRGEWFAASSTAISPVHGPRAFTVDDGHWLLVGFDVADVKRAARSLPGRASARIVDVSDCYASYSLERGTPWQYCSPALLSPSNYAVHTTETGTAIVHCVAAGRYELHLPLPRPGRSRRDPRLH